MNEELNFNTVTPLLKDVLDKLMKEPLLDPFILVGGTNLSLRLGHRRSDDIDLFTDALYGTIDFKPIEDYFAKSFPYFENHNVSDFVGMGRMYYIGSSPRDLVKLDLMYTDAFLSGYETLNGIRMAPMEQIAAMKMHAVYHGGRKKDWWDIHELLNTFSLQELIDLHNRWQPYDSGETRLLRKLIDFTAADGQPDPKCLKNKNWDSIKFDIISIVEDYRQSKKK